MASPRVVSLLASGTEMVCALGCGEWLVGRSHECDHPPWVRRLPPVTAPRFDVAGTSPAIDRDVRSLVEHGSSVYRVDADRLAALAPDVIVTQVQCEVCAVSRRDVDEALAAVTGSRPTIVSLEPDTLADIWRDLRLVAAALGVPERGVQQVTRLRGRMEAVAQRTAGRPRPRVACIEWIEPLMAAGNWTPELVTLAGGEPLLGRAGVHAPLVTAEALVEADPDAIFVTPCGFDLPRIRAEMPRLEAVSGWSDLRAVREGHIYLGDGNAFFNRPGPRVAETVEILAEVLHPEAFRFGHEGTGWERWSANGGPVER